MWSKLSGGKQHELKHFHRQVRQKASLGSALGQFAISTSVHPAPKMTRSFDYQLLYSDNRTGWPIFQPDTRGTRWWTCRTIKKRGRSRGRSLRRYHRSSSFWNEAILLLMEVVCRILACYWNYRKACVPSGQASNTTKRVLWFGWANSRRLLYYRFCIGF